MRPIRLLRRGPANLFALALLAATAAMPAGALTLAVDLDPATDAVESTRSIGLGESITVAVRIFEVTSAAPLNAFELDLGFDPAVATPLTAAAGSFLTSPVFEVENVLDPPEIGIAYATLGSGSVAGDGVLALVTILGSGIGTSALALGDVLLAAPFGEAIEVDALFDGELRVVPEPGTALLLALGLSVVARAPRRRRRRRDRTLSAPTPGPARSARAGT